MTKFNEISRTFLNDDSKNIDCNKKKKDTKSTVVKSRKVNIAYGT